MSTYRELVYLILDSVKSVSDDSHIQEEHVLFLIDKLRVFLLKQRYSDIRKEIPESNYQTICVKLVRTNDGSVIPCYAHNFLKSEKTIPFMMEVSSPRISSPLDFFSGNFSYVNNNRFRYAGSGKYSSDVIYATIAGDNHLYLRSKSPQFLYLEEINITGIFEDSITAASMSCDSANCDYMDKRFPLEESLITPLIEMAVKELSMVKYQAEDSINNANDDLSTIANYIRQQLAEGRRSDLYKNP